MVANTMRSPKFSIKPKVIDLVKFRITILKTCNKHSSIIVIYDYYYTSESLRSTALQAFCCELPYWHCNVSWT